MELGQENILITGAAGFIGAALSENLLKKGVNVFGVDSLNSYYEISLKKARLENIEKNLDSYKGSWKFFNQSINNSEIFDLFSFIKPSIVVNLAAQAGVRYSLKNPKAYVDSNLSGFVNVLECCRINKVKNLVYASSSSVYGGNTNLPFSEIQSVDHPISLYAATKKSNELLAHSYSHLFNIPVTGLRFFTVYGPWGRPDMAPMIFAKAILEGKPISIFNNGNMNRDFTYIDDIVNAISLCCKKPATPDENFNTSSPNPSKSFAPYRLFNIGNRSMVNLNYFVLLLEEAIGREAIKQFKSIEPGDVKSTCANTELLYNWIGFRPSVSIEEGIKKFIDWFLSYYEISKKK